MPPTTGGPQIFNAIRTTRVGNVGAGATDLLTLIVPAFILKNDGDQLLITASCILAANTNNKTTSLLFGSTALTSRGPAGDNGIGQLHEAWVTRLAGNTQQSHGVIMNGATATVVGTIQDSIAEDPGAPITIKLRATGTADNDIVSRFLRVAYIPASYLVGG